MGDGYFGAGCFPDYKRDYGPGIENYECDGCRNDGFVHTGCGDCPYNEARIREYESKYLR